MIKPQLKHESQLILSGMSILGSALLAGKLLNWLPFDIGGISASILFFGFTTILIFETGLRMTMLLNPKQLSPIQIMSIIISIASVLIGTSFLFTGGITPQYSTIAGFVLLMLIGVNTKEILTD